MSTNPYDELGPLTIDPAETYGFAIPLIDDICDWLDKIYDLLPAYEQNQLRNFQDRIAMFIAGDSDELGTAY